MPLLDIGLPKQAKQETDFAIFFPDLETFQFVTP